MNLEVTLKTSVQYLKGVGPERFKVLSRLGLRTIEDLFYFFPRRYENRSPVKRIGEASPGEKECVRGLVLSRGVVRTRHGRSIFRVVLSEAEGPPKAPAGPVLFASWFNQPYLANVFLPKSRAILFGKVEKDGRHLQMIHPEYEMIAPGETTEMVHSGRIVPVYPLTEDLTEKSIRQLLFRVQKEHVNLVPDPLAEPFRKRLGLVDSVTAFRQIHFPDTLHDLEKARRRLVFDEFFVLGLLIQIKKAQMQKTNPAIVHAGGEEQVSLLVQSLGFELTPGQSRAIREVIDDMKRDRPMNRLIQGDVGSGKTAVAAAALVFTTANGFQGALMTPTEALAQQHYFNLTQLLEPLGIHCGYLAQNPSSVEKESVLRQAAMGDLQVLVGTHALIQQKVRFKNLGLAVVDEQHKFGVFQRAELKGKGASPPHFLLMTATPIPRTLALTLYGDLDISTIAELPKGRRAVKTYWAGENKRKEVYAFVDQLIEKGGQGYVICPLIDGLSAAAKSVRAAYGEMEKFFSHRKMGILHGRLKSDAKGRVMREFKEKKIQLLIATVVIEVGIDVPEASVMIIENAERFGLAQLHQLRGRVGRGGEESFCFLFSGAVNEESTERLEAFVGTQSGFEIAEKDLDLRGAGDIIGARQHGLPELRIGDLARDTGILVSARCEAVSLIEADPCLERPEHQILKKILESRFRLAGEKIMVAA